MARKKILVVDDDPACVALIRSGLSSAGFDVIAAQNGEEGFGKLGSEKPDLVITDVMMPGMTGLDFLVRLKARADLTHIPVVVMSSRESFKDFFPAWQVAHFVRKPFTLSEIVGKVAGLLGVSAPGTHSPSALVIGVEDFVVNKLRDHLKGLEFEVHTAVNGPDAVDEAKKVAPDYIFVQVVVDKPELMPAALRREIIKVPGLEKVSFVAFCSQDRSCSPEAVTGINTLIRYEQSDRLLQEVEKYLKQVVSAPV